MPDEFEKEITTKRVTSNPVTPVEGYRVSEQRTTRVNNDSSAAGLILGVLLTLGLVGGSVLYFLNYRPATTQLIPVPGPTNTVREKTTIERNDTTTKEVTPAEQQPAPKVEVNIPAPAATTQPQIITPSPSPAATPSPVPAN